MRKKKMKRLSSKKKLKEQSAVTGEQACAFICFLYAYQGTEHVQFDWTIKARITKKFPLKEWRNARGQGHILNIELVDYFGGQIQATFFNEQAVQFNDKLQENKVYIFSNGQIKIANKKFTSINNDYCINFDKNAKIEESPDDASIQEVAFNFVSIDEINDIEQSKSIDTIGVITQVFEPTDIVVRSTG
eukprot:CAMPEP_0202970298 /NCGR_PEP_ID=MMETSP1396-20130829/16270_1 /ASSEMBLY_ACC=CAM_ASM_000872 /TAXON_ID= /ORGANISM="Pseudokeronopsis sp., Strain Brazil" /LENGTH=188 /DNA_ID=CAMNT_0049698709 /DNA_START=518 /DNA_END=1086 /DNA_ORIENTATION=+